MFRKLRILFLLLVLLFVSVSSYLTWQRIRSWDETLLVYVYPINADDSSITQHYIDKLSDGRFAGIENFMAEQAERYLGRQFEPFRLELAPQVYDLPPEPPAERSIPRVMFWSMQTRLWAWTHNSHPGPEPDIRVFVLYYDPNTRKQVPHSLGLDKGQIGVVHAYANRHYHEENNIVIAHEILHTLGASDKYDLDSNQPLYPQGYVEPDRVPLHPQPLAELMAGRRAVSNFDADMPKRFDEVAIGRQTALEIRWLAP